MKKQTSIFEGLMMRPKAYRRKRTAQESRMILRLYFVRLYRLSRIFLRSKNDSQVIPNSGF